MELPPSCHRCTPMPIFVPDFRWLATVQAQLPRELRQHRGARATEQVDLLIPTRNVLVSLQLHNQHHVSAVVRACRHIPSSLLRSPLPSLSRPPAIIGARLSAGICREGSTALIRADTAASWARSRTCTAARAERTTFIGGARRSRLPGILLGTRWGRDQRRDQRTQQLG